MWLILIPILVFLAIAFNAHQSGKELKEDIKKGFN